MLEVHAVVGEPVESGSGPNGRRRIVPIIGGTFQGHGELTIAGRVVPGGADTQLIHADGLTEADARYALETDRGRLIHVRNRGLRHAPPDVMRKLLAGERVDPSLVYFRTTPTFETDAPELQTLTRSIFVGAGDRYPTEVVLNFWRVD
jgi:hypothetical protein